MTEMQKLYLLVPLAPLLGVCDCRPVRLGNRPHPFASGDHRRCGHFVLGVLDDFSGRAGRTRIQRHGLHLADHRRYAFRGRVPDRLAHHHDDAGGDFRLADGAHLHHRLHARRSGLPAFLQLHFAVHLLHADAGDGQQLPPAVLRLGSRGPGVVSADRLLVYASDGDLRQPESLFGQPGGRFRLSARHRPGAGLLRYAGLRCGVCPGTGHGRVTASVSCLGRNGR